VPGRAHTERDIVPSSGKEYRHGVFVFARCILVAAKDIKRWEEEVIARSALHDSLYNSAHRRQCAS